MTTGFEGFGIEQWLYSVLSGDPTLQASVGSPPNARVYKDHVPQGVTTFPCIVYASSGDDPDTRPVGKYRIMATRHYRVKAVDSAASDVVIAPLASRIDTLLDGQTGQGGNTQIAACVREHGFDRPVVDQGKEYRQCGADYRIQAIQAGP